MGLPSRCNDFCDGIQRIPPCHVFTTQQIVTLMPQSDAAALRQSRGNTSDVTCAARTPVVQRVESLLSRFAGDGGIVNDHVAFRTFGTRGFGIQSIAPAFTDMVWTPPTAHAPVVVPVNTCNVSARQATSDIATAHCLQHVLVPMSSLSHCVSATPLSNLPETRQGYTARDTLEFPAKKLHAQWFAPPPPEAAGSPLPRVFISELKVCLAHVLLSIRVWRNIRYMCHNPKLLPPRATHGCHKLVDARCRIDSNWR